VNRATFDAMGTEVEVWDDSVAALEPVRDWFEEVEARCSRFRPDSELSAINRDPSPLVPLSGMMFEILGAAARARSLTDGLVDVGVGSAVKAWGYDRTFDEVTDRGDAPAPIPAGEWHLEEPWLRRPPDVHIDLGGIAKGWASDRAVEHGLASVVSAGGDLRSNHADTVASITGQHGEVVARLHVGQAAVATSSVGRRRWRVAGAEVSHLVDPRSMRPVETPVVSATVMAATATDAEAGAKAVLMLGSDGLAWADEQPWIAAALVIWHDGSIYGTPGLEVAA
jgi:thiamine biosynthesis lipoprotein